MIDNNFIDAIIQLPDNLFFGTSIATCIMVLKKSKSENKTLFIDASQQFVKITNNNKLTEKHINKIVDAYTKREEIDHFLTVVGNSEIEKQDYNLSVSTYVEEKDTRKLIDIVQLNANIKEIVEKVDYLRNAIDEIIKETEGDDNE